MLSKRLRVNASNTADVSSKNWVNKYNLAFTIETEDGDGFLLSKIIIDLCEVMKFSGTTQIWQ